MFGLLFTVPTYYEAIVGVDPLGAGVRLLPMIGGLVVGLVLADRLAGPIGAKLTVALAEAVDQDARIGHRRGVDVAPDAARPLIGEERHVECGAGGRPEGVVAGDRGTGQEERHRHTGHVAGHEVHVLEHRTHHSGGQQVEHTGHGVRQRQRLLVPRRTTAPSRHPHPDARVRLARRHGEALEGDVVATHRVGVPAHGDGHRHPQVLDRGAVQVVVAAQSSGDRGHESVVER